MGERRDGHKKEEGSFGEIADWIASLNRVKERGRLGTVAGELEPEQDSSSGNLKCSSHSTCLL